MKKNKLIFAFLTCIVLLFALSACDFFGGGKTDESADKIALTKEAITLSETELSYNNGAPCTFRNITVSREGKTVPSQYFTYAYANNINVGEGKLTVTATDDNPSFTGSAELSFTIVPQEIQAMSGATLKSYLENPNYGTVTVGSSGISVDEDLTVPAGKTLAIRNFDLTVNARLTNNGCIEIGFAQEAGSIVATKYATLINKGTIINNGSVTVQNYGKWNDMGTVSGNGTISNGVNGVIVSCGEKLPGVIANGGKETVRVELSAEDITIEYISVTYTPGQGLFCPDYTTDAQVDAVYDNDGNAGEYTLTLIVKDTDESYYGSVVIPYTVEKGTYEGNTLDELSSAILTGNYQNYIFDNLTVAQGKSLDIPQGDTLQVKSLQVTGTVTNGGKIIFENFIQVNANGTLTNNGIIRGTSSSSQFALASGSVCNQNGTVGTAIFNGQSTATLSGLGAIYTDTEQGNFDSFLTLRSELKAEDIALSYTSVAYDGTEHKPEFTVNGFSLSDEDYTVTYSYVGIPVNPETISERGTVEVTITIKDCALCAYKGTANVTYTIE